MFKRVEDNRYTFAVDGRKFETFLAEDGAVEIYSLSDPLHTGFIFESNKQFFSFINNITDIAKDSQGE